jgi:hypothetical protein
MCLYYNFKYSLPHTAQYYTANLFLLTLNIEVPHTDIIVADERNWKIPLPVTSFAYFRRWNGGFEI